MPANRNALVRYKTIDTCLRNRYRRWTLEDLIEACSDALYEYEGIDKGISRRTIQLDIQMMRSEKLGYNAPIVVYDNKYYTYEDPGYSITDTPLSEQDLRTMSEAVEVLRQFKGFSYFSGMGEIVSRLEDHVTSARQKTVPVIDFEKNESLRGLEYLDTVYHAVTDKKALRITYRSFRARKENTFVFFPYLLKEYRNRWFVFGNRRGAGGLLNLALDRIHELGIAEGMPFVENTFFDPAAYFEDMIGVTRNIVDEPETVRFFVNAENAPYVATKPFHKSQRVVETLDDGSVVFEMRVIINHELRRELFGFADAVRVLSPHSLAGFMAARFRSALEKYSEL